MSDQYLQSNNLQLCYEDFGDPTKPVLLLIMGLGCQMIDWPTPFCQALADQGFRVIRFDNRDIGLSDKFGKSRAPSIVKLILYSKLRLPFTVPYTLTDMAKDAIGVMDALNIEKSHIIGASMGGMIAQLVAAHYPKRVLSLTSIMSSSGKRSLPGADREVTKAMTKKSAKTAGQALTNAMQLWRMIGSPDYQPSDEELKNKLVTTAQRSTYPAGYIRQMAAIIKNGSRVKLLKSLKTPTLVIHGKADRLIPVECGIDTAKHIEGSRLELFEGMGHDLPKELQARLVELIANHTLHAGTATE